MICTTWWALYVTNIKHTREAGWTTDVFCSWLDKLDLLAVISEESWAWLKILWRIKESEQTRGDESNIKLTDCCNIHTSVSSPSAVMMFCTCVDSTGSVGLFSVCGAKHLVAPSVVSTEFEFVIFVELSLGLQCVYVSYRVLDLG